MKYVQAYIKPHKVTEVSFALHHVPGLTGMSRLDAMGWGRGKQNAAAAKPQEQVSEFEPHTKIEVFCPDALVEQVVDAIRQAAHTGLEGDGKIYVASIEEAVRISTGEHGEPAC